MKVLAIDSATSSGFAAGDEHCFEDRNAVFGSFRAPKREVVGERLAIFYERLGELITKHEPELIAYEKPYFPLSMVTAAKPSKLRFSNRTGVAMEKGKGPAFNVGTIIFLHNLAGVIELLAAQRGIPAECYTSDQWRPTVFGGPVPRDTDKKRGVMLRMKALGFQVQTDDQSDALGILMHALHGPPASARAQGDLLSSVSADL